MPQNADRKRACPIRISKLHRDALELRSLDQDRPLVSTLGRVLDLALSDEIKAIKRLQAVELERQRFGQVPSPPQ